MIKMNNPANEDIQVKLKLYKEIDTVRFMLDEASWYFDYCKDRDIKDLDYINSVLESLVEIIPACLDKYYITQLKFLLQTAKDIIQMTNVHSIIKEGKIKENIVEQTEKKLHKRCICVVCGLCHFEDGEILDIQNM